jgi:xanthine dehydrogenase YagS FAD-binding subunit
MKSFDYVRPATVRDAVTAAAEPGAVYLAAGTNLLDLMKGGVTAPNRLVDITHLSDLDRIEELPDGALRIGALIRNADLAHDPNFARRFPAVAEALLAGASAQLRNAATVGGNLLQRTRCAYFYDTAGACNKRNPGSGCAAIEGHHRMMAVLGTSEHCIATHPSDMCVAMTALEAVIHVQGAKGQRAVPISVFYKLPGDTPHIENALESGDLITHVELPPAPNTRQMYLKLRDRASYEFALASAAVVARVEGGHIRSVRIALGGVGTRPWRSHEAEAVLTGKAATPANFKLAAEAALKNAKPHPENAFKVELSRRCIVRTLKMATA